jgi:hypothetical protein
MSVRVACITDVMDIELRAYDLDGRTRLSGHRYWQTAYMDRAHAGDPAAKGSRGLQTISLAVSSIHNENKGDTI